MKPPVRVPARIVGQDGEVVRVIDAEFDPTSGKAYFPWPSDLPCGAYQIEAELVFRGEPISHTSQTIYIAGLAEYGDGRFLDADGPEG